MLSKDYEGRGTVQYILISGTGQLDYRIIRELRKVYQDRRNWEGTSSRKPTEERNETWGDRSDVLSVDYKNFTLLLVYTRLRVLGNHRKVTRT